MSIHATLLQFTHVFSVKDNTHLFALFRLASFENHKGEVQGGEECERYQNERDEVDEPAVVEIKDREVVHRRSYEVEEVGVVDLKRAIHPDHNKQESEQV